MRWLLIDKIIECEPGVRAVGIKTFPRSDLFFTDHFPGMPIVPGVLQIEMMAQMGGKCFALKNREYLPVLANVKNAKFYHPIHPGDRCYINAEVIKFDSQFLTVNAFVKVEEQIVSRSEIIFGLLPRTRIHSSDFDAVSTEWMNRNLNI